MRKKNIEYFIFFTEIISCPALLWKFRTNLALRSRVHTKLFFNLLLGFLQNCYSWEKTLSKINYQLLLTLFHWYWTVLTSMWHPDLHTWWFWGEGKKKRTKPHFLLLCLLNRAQSRNNMVYTETKTHHIHITSSIAQCFFSLSQNQKYYWASGALLFQAPVHRASPALG